MVAQLQSPRVPASAIARGKPAAGNKAGQQGQPPTAQLSDYQLANAVGDFNQWQAATLIYKQNFLLPLDDFYEMREPTTPFFQIPDADGNPTVRQYVSPLIRHYEDAAEDLLRGAAMAISVDVGDNPAATQEECDDVAGALKYIVDFHVGTQMGNIVEQVKHLTGLRGMTFVQVAFLDPATAAKSNNRFPVRWDAHDMMDCKWIRGDSGRLAQMIVYKKKKGHQIPLDWQAAGNVTDMAAEYDVLEYWDETSAGALIGGTIVKPLALHGYVDLNGDPCVPFVPFLHKPRAQRIGGVAPLASGLSQYSEIMGTPLCEALLRQVEDDSKIMTYRMHNFGRTSRGMMVLKGVAQGREGNEQQIDIDQGVVVLNDGPDSSFRWEGPPNVDTLADGLSQRIQNDIAAGSATSQSLAGGSQLGVSGASVNNQTSFSRARAESLALTLEEGWTAVLQMTAACLRSSLADGAIDLYKKANGGAAPTVLPTQAAQEFWYGDQRALPQFKGGGVRDFVPATLAGIQRVRVQIEADTRTPSEVEQQQALALEKSGLVDLDWIREHKMHIDNKQAVKDAIILQKMEADPASPWGQFRQKEALINRLIGDIEDPAQKQQVLDALAQQRQQALLAVLAAPTPPPAAAGGPAPPPGQTPSPGGQPGAPPPPQGIGQMPPGAPGQMPMQPPQLLPTVPTQPPGPPAPFLTPPDKNPMQQIGVA